MTTRAGINLIGIGTGNPEHVTLQAIRAMKEADLILIPRKGPDKSDLADLRHTIRAAHAPATRVIEFDMPARDTANTNYEAGVDSWHAAIASLWRDIIARELPEGGEVALLVWGDPALYDSTLRIAARLGLTTRVVPGITALQALTAAHGVSLNEIGGSFLITTGRQLRTEGWPSHVNTLIVMLDGNCAFQTLQPEGARIWWGAFLGMPQQIIRAGDLPEIAPEIVSLRAEARAAHGWIMDTYMLRRGK
jgi:precorrin-6A synthase